MLRNIVKFAGVMIAIVLVGGLALLILRYFNYRASPEYRVEKNLKEIEKQYAEDSFGGDTPEETLALFISALKAGDTDLAAKYFVLDAQPQWREDLAVMKEKGLLKNLIFDMENNLRKDVMEENTMRYNLINEEGFASPVVLVKSINNKWKIRTM